METVVPQSYIFDILQPKHTKVAEFVNDTIIYIQHRNKATIRKCL